MKAARVNAPNEAKADDAHTDTLIGSSDLGIRFGGQGGGGAREG